MCFFSVTVPVFCSFLKAVFPPTAAVAHPAVHGGRISLWVRLSWGLYLFFSLFLCADVWGVIPCCLPVKHCEKFYLSFWRLHLTCFLFYTLYLATSNKNCHGPIHSPPVSKESRSQYGQFKFSFKDKAGIIPCFLLSKFPREEHNYNNPTSPICLWKPVLSSFVLSEDRNLEKLAMDAQSHFQCKSCFQVPSYLLQQSYR